MNQLIKQNYDKALLVLALVAVAWSAAWYWHQQRFVRSLQREQVRPLVTGPAYGAETITMPRSPDVHWSNPPVQSRGSGWLYEVFTPPAITYQAVSQTFAVTAQPAPHAMVDPVGRMELLRVKREPYRLQLLGYFGEPNNYVAVFTTPNSPETMLARPGHRFDEQGLILKSFAVRKIAVEGGDGGPGFEFAAQAVLQDEAAETEVVLDSRMRKLTDTPLAEIKDPGIAVGSRELHEGDTFSEDSASYRVTRIQLDPPEVLLARMSPDLPGPEMSVLRPVHQFPGRISPPNPLAPQATHGGSAAIP